MLHEMKFELIHATVKDHENRWPFMSNPDNVVGPGAGHLDAVRTRRTMGRLRAGEWMLRDADCCMIHFCTVNNLSPKQEETSTLIEVPDRVFVVCNI